MNLSQATLCCLHHLGTFVQALHLTHLQTALTNTEMNLTIWISNAKQGQMSNQRKAMKKYNDLFVWVQLALERCIKLVQKVLHTVNPRLLHRLPCFSCHVGHTPHMAAKQIISSAETVLGWKPNICKCTGLLLRINPNHFQPNTWCAGMQMSVCKLHHKNWLSE